MVLSDEDLMNVIIIPIGVLVVVILALFAFCCLRRRNRQQASGHQQPKVAYNNQKNTVINKPPQQPTTISQTRHNPIKETFRKTVPPSETINHYQENGHSNNNNKNYNGGHHKQKGNYDDKRYKDDSSIQNGKLNNGYNIDNDGGNQIIDEFGTAFDEHLKEQESGLADATIEEDDRSTRRSGGSNSSSKVINVSDERMRTSNIELEDMASSDQHKISDDNNDFNQTITSVKHVQLNEQLSTPLSCNGDGGSKNEVESVIGSQSQPTYVDSS